MVAIDRYRTTSDAKPCTCARGKVRSSSAWSVATRGIDIERLEMVVNYDLPHLAVEHVYRNGRTGREWGAGLGCTCVRQGRSQLAIRRRTTCLRGGRALEHACANCACSADVDALLV